jgi:hypothetical protein
MLTLEVVGLDGSLSTLLFPGLIEEAQDVECPGRRQWRGWQTVVTGRWQHSYFGLGDFWQWRGSFGLRRQWVLNSVIFVFAFLALFDFFILVVSYYFSISKIYRFVSFSSLHLLFSLFGDFHLKIFVCVSELFLK